MEKKQHEEWLEAQKIVISEDLVDVAKKQLEFLAVVDRHRCLYEGPVLERAIFRYKTYWLPLLAKHTKSDDAIDGPLVVPLDCEWIWHCHRLNPLRYKSDCEEFFGQIMDNKLVISSIVHGSPKQKTEEIWSNLYPEEPYELDLTDSFTKNNLVTCLTTTSQSKNTQYDLIDAVKRQRAFFYQVSTPSMNDDLFLEGAVARYKGFLHLIKRNKERSIRLFCVPTIDIDLIWHSHQLNPVSYCKDMVETMGIVIQHDDTVSNRAKGQKLDIGFSGTTKQWENTFGSRYWRAGAMYRNAAPFPITDIPWKRESKNFVPLSENPKLLQLPTKMVVEVLLEIVDVKNLPENHKENIFVLISKNKPDSFFTVKKPLSIRCESLEKRVSSFECEPNGELFLELMSNTTSSLPMSRPAKTMGTTSIPLNCMMEPNSKFSVEEWFDLESSFGTLDSNPICLRIGISISVPGPAPHVLEIVRSHPYAKSRTCVIDEAGNKIMDIHMRELKNAAVDNNMIMKKEITGVVRSSGETQVLAEFVGSTWYLVSSNWSFQIKRTYSTNGHIFELNYGDREVKLCQGKKLEYKTKSCREHNNELVFITAIEFSAKSPYGKAVALLDLKSGVVKVNEDWFVLPGITLNFLLSNILRRDGYDSLIVNECNPLTNNLMEDEIGNAFELEKVVDKKKHRNLKNSSCAECWNIMNDGGCGSRCGSGSDGNCRYTVNNGAEDGKCIRCECLETGGNSTADVNSDLPAEVQQLAEFSDLIPEDLPPGLPPENSDEAVVNWRTSSFQPGATDAGGLLGFLIWVS